MEQQLAMTTAHSQQQPLISVIMPAYNAGRYIEQAIQSVLQQSWPNWELLIVDDASTDNTEEVVSRFQTDARIHYQKVARIGHPAGVRNTALKTAKGDFIAFLDADDLYFPHALTRLIEPLMKDSNLIAAYGFAASIDEHNQPLPDMVPLIPDSNSATGLRIPAHYSHDWAHIVTSQINCLLPSLLLRRSAWEQIGFFNETLCGPEDYEFFVRMYLLNHAGVTCLSDYIYQYRIHSASLTKAPEHCERVLQSCLRIMEWLFKEANIPAEVRGFESKAYVGCYKHLARERLLNKQPAIARKLSAQAFQDPHIGLLDSLKACGPLWLRSFLPVALDESLVDLKRSLSQVREKLYLSIFSRSEEVLL